MCGIENWDIKLVVSRNRLGKFRYAWSVAYVDLSQTVPTKDGVYHVLLCCLNLSMMLPKTKGTAQSTNTLPYVNKMYARVLHRQLRECVRPFASASPKAKTLKAFLSESLVKV